MKLDAALDKEDQYPKQNEKSMSIITEISIENNMLKVKSHYKERIIVEQEDKISKLMQKLKMKYQKTQK